MAQDQDNPQKHEQQQKPPQQPQQQGQQKQQQGQPKQQQQGQPKQQQQQQQKQPKKDKGGGGGGGGGEKKGRDEAPEVPAGPKVPPRLKVMFEQKVAPKLVEKFGLKNPMQHPKIAAVVVNVNMGRHLEGTKL